MISCTLAVTAFFLRMISRVFVVATALGLRVGRWYLRRYLRPVRDAWEVARLALAFDVQGVLRRKLLGRLILLLMRNRWRWRNATGRARQVTGAG